MIRPATASITCPRCGGEGRIQHRGMSTVPNSGVPGWDPQQDWDETCPRCYGTGHTQPRFTTNRNAVVNADEVAHQ